jgi:tetratricopeptide (TPR) repeat protein
LLQAGEFEIAKDHVDRAIKLSDEAPIDYLLTRGRLWHALGDSTSANEDFAEVIRRDPGASHRVPAE